MPRLTVRPDDLPVAGAGLSDDAVTLAGAAAALRAAGAEAGAALGPEAAVVHLALADYVAVDEVFAAALGEAVTLLGQALLDAGEAYAWAEATVASGWSGGRGS